MAERVPDLLPVLALAAAGLALAVPSQSVASHVDILLALLVLATALDIDPRGLLGVAGRVPALALVALFSLVVLGLGGWALGQLVHGAVRDGALALGFAPAEVASVGLIGLMGGASELAIAVLAVSLTLSAVVGPPALVLLGHAGHVGHGAHLAPLLGRFALVVLAPLALGLFARGVLPGVARHESGLAASSSLLVAGLVYASLSATHTGELGSSVLVSLAFLGLCAAVAGGVVLAAGHRFERSLALTIGMRDFAVAAALAAAAFGPRAAQVAGVYGTLMLIAGAGVTTLVRRSGSRARPRTARP